MKKDKTILKGGLTAAIMLACLIGVKSQNINYPDNAGNAGNYNTSIGYEAGKAVTGSRNTFIGNKAGYNNTTGTYNTFVGNQNGYSNTTGSQNTLIGHEAGNKISSGNNNTLVGVNAGHEITTGSSNSFFGRYVGFHNRTGGTNTLFGYYSGYNNNTGSGNVFMGSYSGYYETGSNKLYIDNSSTSEPLIWGDFSSNIAAVNGQLGVGTNSPRSGSKLHVSGGYGISIDRNEGHWGNVKANIGVGTNGLRFTVTSDGNWYNMVDALFLQGNGNVGIGTTSPSTKLTVHGEIRCSKVRVTEITNIPDYVFENDYELMKIEEVEAYVRANKHLPEVPSAEVVESKGMDMGEMNKILLKKVEEQMLYIIELSKRISEVEEQLKNN